MKSKYHEVYGWMPQDIINRLNPIDKSRMIINFIMREPTLAGWKIVSATIKELGDNFLEYMLQDIINLYQGNEESVTKETLIGDIKDMITSFATDTNTFRNYVDIYLEKNSDSDVEDDAEPKNQMPGRDAKGRFIKKEKK